MNYAYMINTITQWVNLFLLFVFICFTADGVNCFLYDLGQSVLISGIRIKSKGKIIGK